MLAIELVPATEPEPEPEQPAEQMDAATRWASLDRAKLLTSGRNFTGAALFSSLAAGTLRRVAAKLEYVSFAPGEVIVKQGDVGRDMYIILEGRCSVTWEMQRKKGAALGAAAKQMDSAPDMMDGDVFGEIALLTEQPRSATIAAKAENTVHTMRLAKTDVKPILDNVWGSDEDIEARRSLLAEVPLFARLSMGEMLQLATQMEEITYEDDNRVIIQQGRLGDCMYIVLEGEPRVDIEGVGAVAQLQPKDYFGELAIIDAPASWRMATVKTTGFTTLLRLSQGSVHGFLGELYIIHKSSHSSLEIFRFFY